MSTPSRPPVVDTHNHFWDIERSELYWLQPTPETAPLRRSFTPPDLKPQMDAVGVERSVIIQAASSRWDNLWWLGLTEEYPYVSAVIGWVDLERPDVGAALDEYRAHPAFRGVRATAEDVDDPDWIARPEVRRGIGEVASRGLVLDLLVRTPHLRHVPSLASEFPDLPMVIDHLAKPAIESGDLDEWYAGMERVARETGVWAKISGLLTEAGPDPTTERIRPVVAFALEEFGAGRLMWGSDWPVCTLAAPYVETYRTVTAALDPLPDADRSAILGGNAVAFYSLR